MAVEESAQVSEAQIAVHWREEEYYLPPARFIGQANAAIRRSASGSSRTFPRVLQGVRRAADWDSTGTRRSTRANPPFWKWFVGGRLNACFNCVDRHLDDERGNKAALIWVPEPEERGDAGDHLPRSCTSGSTSSPRCSEDFCGVQAGDPGHVPHADGPRAAGGDARVRPARRRRTPRSSAASRRRVRRPHGRLGSNVLVTMDGYYRNGELIDHKAKADEAMRGPRGRGRDRQGARLAAAPGSTRRVPDGRRARLLVDELLEELPGRPVVEPVLDASEAPLFLMYTSGTTGEPKGCQHTTAGYLAYVADVELLQLPPARTPTGAPPTSAGSPATATSSTARSALGDDQVMYEGVPDLPRPGPPVARSPSARRDDLPHGADDDPHAAKLGPDEPANTTTTSST